MFGVVIKAIIEGIIKTLVSIALAVVFCAMLKIIGG